MSQFTPDRVLVALPDGTFVDAFRGYRAWRVTATQGDVSLNPITFPQEVWPKGVFEAKCNRWKHEAPASQALPVTNAFLPACSCGINAYAHPAMVARKFNPQSFILGEVELWGTVRIHEFGYRASHGRVAALWQPNHGHSATVQVHRLMAEIAAKRYEVPLVQAPPEAARLIEVS